MAGHRQEFPNIAGKESLSGVAKTTTHFTPVTRARHLHSREVWLAFSNVE